MNREPRVLDLAFLRVVIREPKVRLDCAANLNGTTMGDDAAREELINKVQTIALDNDVQ